MIELKNVTKKYGQFYAVRDLNFKINDGEIVGLLGRNGAGKSTTMNIITGFIEPTDGEVFVDGDDIDRKPAKVKRKIGYMPEGTPLYSDLTVKEFVSYMADLKMIPRKEKKSAVEKALRSTGLERVQNNLTKILSRGYKQRVSFAGAIVGEPEILILDEPTVGLDPKQVIEIRELIKSYRENHTVIISSHILSEISQICERVIIIDKGEIVAIDTPANLEKNTTTNQVIKITVEESEEGKLEDCKEELTDIKEISLVAEKEDGTKEYMIQVENEKDIRKELSKWCGKSDILIIEMKVEENSLEDAFVHIINNRVERTQEEIKKLEEARIIAEFKREQEEIKQFKQSKKEEKQKIKEEKVKIKAEKAKIKEEKKANKKNNEEPANESNDEIIDESNQEDKKEGKE